MWKRAKGLILRDVKNENEMKLYAVILRMNLLLMLPYYLILGSVALWKDHFIGVTLGMAGLLLCLLLLHATYHNKTKLAAYTFIFSLAIYTLLFAVSYGNDTSVYSFIYVQIVLVYVLDYISFFKKNLYTIFLLAVRLAVFIYVRNQGALYPQQEQEELFLQMAHTIITSLLLMATSILSTQDFREMQKKLVSYNKKLRDIAGIDPLTGLRNRRSEIEQILEKIRKYQNGEVQALTIAIGDIDFFKRINDTYGHNCGDIVLRELADLFKTFMRTKGDVCRWGGEEFLFIFNDINGDDASYMLQELRAEIQKRGINFGQEVIHATMTFGVAEYDLRRSLEHNIEDADQELYIGKEKGRNIIIY